MPKTRSGKCSVEEACVRTDARVPVASAPSQKKTTRSARTKCKKTVTTIRRSSRIVSQSPSGEISSTIGQSPENSSVNIPQTTNATAKRSRSRSNRATSTSIAIVDSQQNPRRSKRIKGLKDNHLDHETKISTVTPSPAILNGCHSRSCVSDLNAKDVANDIFIDMNMAQDSHSSSIHCNDDSKSLPPGVHSILCPYAQSSRRQSIRSTCTGRKSESDEDTPTDTDTDTDTCTSGFKCGCFFRFNDCSSEVNIESYLSAYNSEYIRSLYEGEFNISHVQEDFFPRHLQVPSRKRTQGYAKKLARRAGPKRKSPRFKRTINSTDDKRESSREFFRPDMCTSSDSDNETSKRSKSLYIPSSTPTQPRVVTPNTSIIKESRSLAQRRFEYYMDYTSRQDNMTTHMRSVLVDWLIEVAEEFKISSIALHTAVGLVDRCLGSCVIAKYFPPPKKICSCYDYDGYSSNSCSECYCSSPSPSESNFDKDGPLTVDRTTLQLLGCGCMIIACKMHEVTPPDVNDFRYISASTYNKRQIIDMELSICSLLAFNMHIITPHHFANIYLRANYVSGNGRNRTVCSIPNDDTMKFLVDYLLEISCLSYELSQVAPSKIACAAVYLARATLNIRDVSDEYVSCDDTYHTQGYLSQTLKYYSGYDEQDIEDIVIRLRSLHGDADSDTLRSVYEKYSQTKVKKAAFIIPIEMDLLLESFCA